MNDAAPATPSQPKLPARRWTFFRAGGIDQVSLATGEDLSQLRLLDPKLWTALSCPVRGLERDEATLALIDADKDGIVRVPELLDAIDWAIARLGDPEALVDGVDRLALSKIRSDTPAGAAILGAARAILDNLGKPDAQTISVAETRQRSEIFGKASFNGDGIVPPAAASDAEVAQAIADIVACLGGKRDRSGELGVDREALAAFYEQLEKYASFARGAAPEDTPLGFDAFRKIKAKLDDYFARCSLVAFDPASAEPLNRHADAFESIRASDLSALPESVRQMPLALPRADLVLDLAGPLNPAWRGELEDFRAAVLDKIGAGSGQALAQRDWEAIRRRFQTAELREQELDSFSIRQLSVERIQALATGDIRGRIEALIVRDEALADEVAAVDDLDRLVRYQRDLLPIARNFVNFSDFFAPGLAANFQAGMLYIDSRACHLCVRVANPLAHATLAALSRCYILYCECQRAGEPTMQIAAVISAGGSDYLMVGRNGVFYDRAGRDWHARVVKIIENPISIAQAFWSPYKSFAGFIDAQLSKRAEASEKAVSERLASTAETVSQADKQAAAPKPQKIEVGTVAAISVAIGSIGTFVSMLLIRAVSLGPWLPMALVVVVLLISLPSMFLAWLRLRRRTLGPILDANGWAVNGQIKINRRLATTLTETRKLPPNARRDLAVPTDRSSPATAIAVALALILATAAAIYLYRSGIWAPTVEPAPEPVPVTAAPAAAAP